MKKSTLTFCICFVSVLARAQSKELKTLVNYMTGTYSSQEQHKADTLNYFNIKLEIIPIWKESKDGFWLYVEQAVAGSENKPYRQRVYHITETKDNTFESAVFTFNKPLRFAGNVALFEKTLNPDSLILRDGCSVFLKYTKDNSFEGGTEGKNCASERQGAAYATANVTITKNELKSWDRGFNEKDEQVWGATKGGYVFIKVKYD